MRKILLLLIIFCIASASTADAKKIQLAPSYAWQIEPTLGLHLPSTIDTIPDNYGQSFVPAVQTEAWLTTGNYGSEGKSMLWADHTNTSKFFFRDAFKHWLPSANNMKFYNTRIPMTLLSYSSAGGRDNSQERLHGVFSGNVNKKFQIGALLDYIYSKGCYNAQANSTFTWGLSSSYMGDRYEFQGFFYHYDLLTKENGGITDPLYITDPALVQGGDTRVDTKTIPTHLTAAHTRLKGQQIYLNNRYKIGYYHEEYEGDSVVSRTFVPVTAITWTLDYNDDKHLFIEDSPSEIKNFFTNRYLNSSSTDDLTSYSSFKNTLGLSLLEGFHKYAKFGLSAFVTYEILKYHQTADIRTAESTDLTPLPDGMVIKPNETKNKVFVGGQLSKQKGSILTYSATAQFGVAPDCIGETNIKGNITTRIPMLGDSIAIKAYGSFVNKPVSYFMQKYISNHFAWQNKYDKERILRIGGNFYIPQTRTTLEVEAATVKNHVYFNSDFLPTSHGDNVEVLSARLYQNVKLGVLHWDNRITYQKSSQQAVIPLPELALYSNLYIKFKIATLFVQLGIDCNYYTKYYAPKFQPATASFANQQEQKFGNYPIMNAYANFKLSKTRFFVLFSHVNQGWFSKDYFSMQNYPLNPRRLQIGLSVDFAN